MLPSAAQMSANNFGKALIAIKKRFWQEAKNNDYDLPWAVTHFGHGLAGRLTQGSVANTRSARWIGARVLKPDHAGSVAFRRHGQRKRCVIPRLRPDFPWKGGFICGRGKKLIFQGGDCPLFPKLLTLTTVPGILWLHSPEPCPRCYIVVPCKFR